jgi:hypothetical protein
VKDADGRPVAQDEIEAIDENLRAIGDGVTEAKTIIVDLHLAAASTKRMDDDFVLHVAGDLERSVVVMDEIVVHFQMMEAAGRTMGHARSTQPAFG